MVLYGRSHYKVTPDPARLYRKDRRSTLNSAPHAAPTFYTPNPTRYVAACGIFYCPHPAHHLFHHRIKAKRRHKAGTTPLHTTPGIHFSSLKSAYNHLSTLFFFFSVLYHHTTLLHIVFLVNKYLKTSLYNSVFYINFVANQKP